MKLGRQHKGHSDLIVSYLNVKVLIGSFNQVKALVGAFSVITNLEALVPAYV